MVKRNPSHVLLDIELKNNELNAPASVQLLANAALKNIVVLKKHLRCYMHWMKYKC